MRNYKVHSNLGLPPTYGSGEMYVEYNAFIFGLPGNSCVCDNGVAESGTRCPVNGAAKCISCYAGWILNRDRTTCTCTCCRSAFVIARHTAHGTYILVFGTTTALVPASCNVGDAVKAKYKVDGNLYGAHIAQTDGDFITVNWNDGGADHLSIHKKDVFKNGVSCDSSAGRPMLCFGIAILLLLYRIRHGGASPS